MGLNIGFNALTSGGLLLVTILLVLTGILFLSAANKLASIPGYNSSSKLQNGYKKLQTAYILTFVAAGVALLLVFIYGGHEILWSPTEWIHTGLFLVMVAIMIIANVYAYVILNDLYVPELTNRNGTDSFIWAGLWLSVLAFFAIMAVGSGRFGYNAVRGKVQDHFDHFKTKVDETHMRVTGSGNVDDGLDSTLPIPAKNMGSVSKYPMVNISNNTSNPVLKTSYTPSQKRPGPNRFDSNAYMTNPITTTL
jgi:hypothetical protein